jgi:hypothetical protein
MLLMSIDFGPTADQPELLLMSLEPLTALQQRLLSLADAPSTDAPAALLAFSPAASEHIVALKSVPAATINGGE